MSSQRARSETSSINEEKFQKKLEVPVPALETIQQEVADVGYAEYRKGLDVEVVPEQLKNRRVRWKIDLIILPIFLVTQTLQFLDKTALNYANLFGFRTALHLSGVQFSWLSGIVYAGYFVGQYPSSYLIGRYPAQRVIAISIVIWGIAVITMTQCRSFSEAMANRFFLGIFESAISPGQTIMTGFWYTRNEIPLRQFIWYSGLGWGGLIGSYMSTGISTIRDNSGPAKWQYIFYILGGVTILWGVFVWFALSDSPANAWFLNEPDRIIAVKRVSENQTGIKNKHFKKEQVWSTLRDPKMYILFFSIFAAAIPNGVLSSFSTEIINEMGFSQTKTTVLKSVGDILQIVSLFIGGFITLNFENTRLITSTAANIICTVAAACTGYLALDKTWMRLVAFWFTNCQSVGFATSLVMVSSNMGGYTHKTIANAILFTAYCWGNLAGPFVVKQSEAPKFPTAMAGLLAGYSVKLALHLVLFVYLVWTNAHRNKVYGPPDEAASREAGMQDKTEFENKHFRYVY
ncbi:mfs transporter [Moniliophthora roreri MCA 2997]|uniref:Mfs transporter n=1 Tax=Moniliophthora roreri (strain MCA 2997) TaxID=1381753 RepID=V2XMI2_MONRO|nr:mfs transporter [Moniliophthora roreri MCA 2997]